jgi:hypothetical protein
VLLATIALASPARADGCEDIAGQLKGQIDGLKVGITAARVTYLSHPDAKEMSLGCRGRDYSNELYAKADGRGFTSWWRAPRRSSLRCRSTTR